MKKAVVATLAALAAVTGTVVLAAPANALGGTRTCSIQEYRKVDRGDSLTRVQRILDGKGHLQSAYSISGHRYTSREWGSFGDGGYCSVDFRDGHVKDKFYT